MKSIFAMTFLMITLTACQLGNASGYVPTRQEVQQIQVGQDTKATVLERYGSPTVVGQSDNHWYYIASYQDRTGPLPERETLRRVLKITFNGADVVTGVNETSLAQGQEVAHSNYVTPTDGERISLWDQILGNFGNFSAERFVSGLQ